VSAATTRGFVFNPAAPPAFTVIPTVVTEVATRLLQGWVNLRAVMGQGCLEEIRFFVLLGVGGKGYRRVMFPIAWFLMAYRLEVLLGIPSMNLAPSKLFRELKQGWRLQIYPTLLNCSPTSASRSSTASAEHRTSPAPITKSHTPPDPYGVIRGAIDNGRGSFRRVVQMSAR